MQLHLDHLYQILTQEAFSAADRFSPMLATVNEDQYDVIVQNMARELKSVVMWDGEIEEKSRESVVSHVIARTQPTQAMHDNVDRAFWGFALNNATEGLQEILTILMHGSHRLSSRFSGGERHIFQREWLYGEWMPEYTLKQPLQNLSQVHRFLDLTDQECKLKGDARAQVVRKKLSADNTGDYARLFEVFMRAFQNHPHKNKFIDKLGEKHSIMMLRHNQFNFDNCLSSETDQQLTLLLNEIDQLWLSFGTIRIDMLSRDLAQTVRLRCNTIMKTMMDAPIIEPTTEASVTVDKTSIEQFRSKSVPTPTKSSVPD